MPRFDNRFGRFLVTGAFAAGVNVSSRWALDFVLSYSAAIVCAYLLGMGTAFFLSRRFVFEKTALSARVAFLRFSLVNLFALFQVWGVSLLLAEIVFPWIDFSWHRHDLAHGIGVAVPAITSYWGHKYFSFAQTPARRVSMREPRCRPG